MSGWSQIVETVVMHGKGQLSWTAISAGWFNQAADQWDATLCWSQSSIRTINTHSVAVLPGMSIIVFVVFPLAHPLLGASCHTSSPNLLIQNVPRNERNTINNWTYKFIVTTLYQTQSWDMITQNIKIIITSQNSRLESQEPRTKNWELRAL